MQMTSDCDVTNSAHQIQMNTIWPWTNPPMKIFCVRHCLWKTFLFLIGYATCSAHNGLRVFTQGFLRYLGNPIRVPRIENWVPRIRENYHRVPRIRENRVRKITEIGSLQVHTGYLIFLKKIWFTSNPLLQYKLFTPRSGCGHIRWLAHRACRTEIKPGVHLN